MQKTAVKSGDPEVTITPAPNGRANVHVEGRMFTLVNVVLTNEEIVALLSGLTNYVLNHSPEGSEYERGN